MNGRNPKPASIDKRTPSRVRVDHYKNRIVTLYMEGRTLEAVRDAANLEIGHKFSTGTISSYINEALASWEKNKAHMVEHHKTIELEKINRLELHYWEGYQRSLQVSKTKTDVKTKDSDGETKKLALSQVRTESKPGGAGDPRFLNGVQWCIDKRCEILGITTPLVPIINNQQNNITTDNRTMIVRRNIFKTRETTTAMQVLPEAAAE